VAVLYVFKVQIVKTKVQHNLLSLSITVLKQLYASIYVMRPQRRIQAKIVACQGLGDGCLPVGPGAKRRQEVWGTDRVSQKLKHFCIHTHPEI